MGLPEIVAGIIKKAEVAYERLKLKNSYDYFQGFEGSLEELNIRLFQQGMPFRYERIFQPGEGLNNGCDVWDLNNPELHREACKRRVRIDGAVIYQAEYRRSHGPAGIITPIPHHEKGVPVRKVKLLPKVTPQTTSPSLF